MIAITTKLTPSFTRVLGVPVPEKEVNGTYDIGNFPHRLDAFVKSLMVTCQLVFG